MPSDYWTEEDGYKLIIRSNEFKFKGKIWIGILPILGMKFYQKHYIISDIITNIMYPDVAECLPLFTI